VYDPYSNYTTDGTPFLKRCRKRSRAPGGARFRGSGRGVGRVKASRRHFAFAMRLLATLIVLVLLYHAGIAFQQFFHAWDVAFCSRGCVCFTRTLMHATDASIACYFAQKMCFKSAGICSKTTDVCRCPSSACSLCVRATCTTLARNTSKNVPDVPLQCN
jgi:hypothetical protein